MRADNLAVNQQLFYPDPKLVATRTTVENLVQPVNGYDFYGTGNPLYVRRTFTKHFPSVVANESIAIPVHIMSTEKLAVFVHWDWTIVGMDSHPAYFFVLLVNGVERARIGAPLKKIMYGTITETIAMSFAPTQAEVGKTIMLAMGGSPSFVGTNIVMEVR